MPTAVSNMDLDRAAALLRGGGLVAFPTETVYGLGANALDAQAVARIFEAKGRPRFDPLIVHLPDRTAAQALVTTFPPLAHELAAAFWPGPMTLVLPKRVQVGRSVVPDLVTAGLPTVALRVPAHPVALELLRRAKVPVAAPSANRFGHVSPTLAAHVRDELGDAVDMVLDGGPCATGVESTVISLLGDQPTVLRLGGLAIEQIERVIGPVAVARPQAASAEQAEQGQQSPGMLSRHYAPRTPLRLVDALPAVPPGERVGLLTLTDPGTAAHGYAAVQVLSPTGDLREAAARLFAAMRQLDQAGLTLIVAQRVPERDLGRAINDRLRRASARDASG